MKKCPSLADGFEYPHTKQNPTKQESDAAREKKKEFIDILINIDQAIRPPLRISANKKQESQLAAHSLSTDLSKKFEFLLFIQKKKRTSDSPMAEKTGPEPGDRVVIGITFGNSNSSIAYTVDDKAEVIANEDGGECFLFRLCVP